MLVPGIGMGLLLPGMALTIQVSAHPKESAIAAAMFIFSRHLGQTVGLAIGGDIFQNRMAGTTARVPQFADAAKAYSVDVVSLIKALTRCQGMIPESFCWKPLCPKALALLGCSLFMYPPLCSSPEKRTREFEELCKSLVDLGYPHNTNFKIQSIHFQKKEQLSQT